jgi:hypothetical protein
MYRLQPIHGSRIDTRIVAPCIVMKPILRCIVTPLVLCQLFSKRREHTAFAYNIYWWQSVKLDLTNQNKAISIAIPSVNCTLADQITVCLYQLLHLKQLIYISAILHMTYCCPCIHLQLDNHVGIHPHGSGVDPEFWRLGVVCPSVHYCVVPHACLYL